MGDMCAFRVLGLKHFLMEYLNGNPLTRFIMNVCSSEEKNMVLQWLSESDNNKATLRHFEQLVNHMVGTTDKN